MGEKTTSEYNPEITPEMIDAGVGALFKFDPRFENEEEAVKNIFLAMLKKFYHDASAPLDQKP
jgi:hypothetical protein